MSDTHLEPRPVWSQAGLIEGARAMLPIMPSAVAFALALGALAAQKGFTLGETLGMSLIAYSGTAQVIVLEVWPDRFTLGAALSMVLLTTTINLRYILYGVSFRSWLGPLPAWQSYPILALMTDGGWLVGVRYRSQGGSDVSFLLGGCVLFYVVWCAAVVPGYLLAGWLANPKTWGLDLMVPVFFAALLVSAWRGPSRALPWLASGIVALVVDWIMPGWWFIMAGAIAGAITGGLIDDE